MKVTSNSGNSEASYFLEMPVPWLPPGRFLAHVYHSVTRGKHIGGN